MIESFDCRPAGGEVPDPIESPPLAKAPPCFVAPPSLFQDQKVPRLRRGHAPLVPGPTGGDRRGTEPARP